jgi:hypothetical protein
MAMLKPLRRIHFLILGSILAACSKADDPATGPVDSGVDSSVVVDARADTAVALDAPADGVLDAVAEAGRDTSVADAARPDDSIDDDGPIDTRAESPPPLSFVDCLTDDFGPSTETFVDLLYERQVAPCESSACTDFYKLDTSCTFTVQVADVEHVTTLSAAHCAKVTKWLSSDRLVSHIKDTVTCYGVVVAGKFEATSLALGSGRIAKKTFMCPDEPFASHRACLDSLRSIYFPGL